jgi:N-acetylmuramoyl-L-alanine amidase
LVAILEIPGAPALLTTASRLWLIVFVLAVAASASPMTAQAPAALSARFMVVLDAAHGGDDPGGKLSDGQPEKAFTLALSVRLRSLLGARGMQVITTRESDASVDLDRRAEIANHANAQACLSLHASETGTGIHLFVSSLTPAPSSEGVRFLAWRTAQSAWITRSVALAGVLNSVLLHAGMSVTQGRTALPAVDSMRCPAVAIEVAPEAAAAGAPGQPPASELNDPAYQARVAEALAAALLEWRADPGRTEATEP